MKISEKWNVGIGLSQTIILLFTLLAAVVIGVQQNRINQNLLELNYTPSIELVFDNASDRLQVWNRGNTNLYLWGTKFHTFPEKIEEEGRLIAPSGYYFLETNKVGSNIIEPILDEVGVNGQKDFYFDLYFKSDNSRKYSTKNLLRAFVNNGDVNIHTQTLQILPSDW